MSSSFNSKTRKEKYGKLNEKNEIFDEDKFCIDKWPHMDL